MAGSSSDDDCYDPDWIFYRDRPEWKDITPLPQDDGPHPVVQIAYSEKFNRVNRFTDSGRDSGTVHYKQSLGAVWAVPKPKVRVKDIFDYLRAVMRTKEISERVLLLTTDAINQNPANYSVWTYRRDLLQGLNKNLKEELSYCSGIITHHSKSYQVWQHRKVIVDWLKDPSEEVKFCEKILKRDAKNYHAWQYRQWVVKEFSLWDNELDYINSLLEQDVRNNSAWNHRYFVLSNTTNFNSEVIKSEVLFTKEKIHQAPHNESSWSYLRGILFLRDFDPYCYGDIWKFCEKLYDSDVGSSYLLEFMIQCIEEHLEQTDNSGSEEAKLLEKAIHLCQQLADDIDTIRKEYWNYMSQKLVENFGKKE
ncbi:Protein farnesyltransferase/geranylgeranyltransferase type-1 subunit alpha [Nymphon striatum]|nr:Protein farnesyltransferase/geranylgeranyltransferase type-1 subunit alpha [Nymphon striatum]